MKDYATLLYQWLSTFAETYRSPVQFDADNPQPTEYIEYSLVQGNFAEGVIQPITIYTQSTSYKYVMEIVDKIDQAVGESGIKLSGDVGYVWIMKGSPFYQDKPDEDSSIRAGYVNLLIKMYQKGIK